MDSGVGQALRWSYLLSVGRFAIGGALTFVLAAILDPYAVGLMFLAMVWISFVLMLVHNATLPLIQQDGVHDEHFSAAFWGMLAAAGGVAVLIFMAAPLLAALNRTPELTDVVRTLAPLVVLEAVTAVPDARLRRRLQFRSLAVRSLIAVIVGGGVGVALAASGLGVWALVGQQLANSAAYVVTLFLFRPWTPTRGPVLGPLREMRATAAKSVAGFLGWFIAKRTDALLMGVLFGPVAVGLYRLATRLAELVVELTSSALNQVCLPDLSSRVHEPAEFVHRLRGYLHTNAALAFPLLGIVAATAAPMLAVLGPEWTDAADAMRVLCVAGAVGIVTVLLGTALLAAQRPGAEAVTNWVQAGVGALAIAAGAVATRDAGIRTQILAIALAVLATECVLSVVLWHVTFRRVLRVPGRRVLPVLVPAAAAGVAADAAGWAVLRLGADRLPVLAQVATAAVTGAVVAGTVLMATDPTARTMIRGLIRGLIGRLTGPAPRWRRRPYDVDSQLTEPIGPPLVEPVPALLPAGTGDQRGSGQQPQGGRTA